MPWPGRGAVEMLAWGTEPVGNMCQGCWGGGGGPADRARYRPARVGYPRYAYRAIYNTRRYRESSDAKVPDPCNTCAPFNDQSPL